MAKNIKGSIPVNDLDMRGWGLHLARVREMHIGTLLG